MLTVTVEAAEGDFERYKGRAVAEVIDVFGDAGYPFAYSTNLVGSDLQIGRAHV